MIKYRTLRVPTYAISQDEAYNLIGEVAIAEARITLEDNPDFKAALAGSGNLYVQVVRGDGRYYTFHYFQFDVDNAEWE